MQGMASGPIQMLAEMVSREKIDVVIICTPHPNHREPTIAALEAGANVLIEKPLASSLEDCDAMIEASQQCGRQIGLICQRRWYIPAQRVKQAIEDGKIGKPVFATVNMLGWRDKEYYDSDPWRGTWKAEGGGVLVNQAPHQLDLLQWYMGEIDECFGLWSNLNHPYIEVEDTANAILKFKNGGSGQYHRFQFPESLGFTARCTCTARMVPRWVCRPMGVPCLWPECPPSWNHRSLISGPFPGKRQCCQYG